MPFVLIPRWKLNRISQKEISAAKLRRLKKMLLARKARREARRANSTSDVEQLS